MFLTYVLGPLSPVALRGGRLSWLWAATLPLTCLTWLLVVLGRNELVARVGLSGVLVGLGFGSLLAGLTLAGWSRAIGRLGTPGGATGRNPLLLLAFGLFVPGLGLVLDGHPRRGALAFWFWGVGVVAGVWLWFGSRFWNWSRVHSTPDPARILEIGFVAAALLCVLGAGTWVGQALDGLRLNPGKTSMGKRSDWALLSLVGALVLLLGMFRPSEVAVELDRTAREWRADEYQVLPALAGLTAVKLDPSQPRYALAAAEYLEELGKEERAAGIREDLARRWASYSEWRDRSRSPGSVPGEKALPEPSTWSRITGFYAGPPPPPPSERP